MKSTIVFFQFSDIHMGIYGCSRDTLMTQELLYFPYTCTPLQEVGGKTVPQAVRSDILIDTCILDTGFDNVPYAPGSKAGPKLIKK